MAKRMGDFGGSDTVDFGSRTSESHRSTEAVTSKSHNLKILKACEVNSRRSSQAHR